MGVQTGEIKSICSVSLRLRECRNVVNTYSLKVYHVRGNNRKIDVHVLVAINSRLFGTEKKRKFMYSSPTMSMYDLRCKVLYNGKLANISSH